jgi:hypothetical protein
VSIFARKIGRTTARFSSTFMAAPLFSIEPVVSMLSRGVTAADQWGLRVVSVDYTLAPRAKYNQITDECVAVIKALMQQGTNG